MKTLGSMGIILTFHTFQLYSFGKTDTVLQIWLTALQNTKPDVLVMVDRGRHFFKSSIHNVQLTQNVWLQDY